MMVFSRYVTVLRAASKTLRNSLLDSKVKHKGLVIQRLENCRAFSTQEKNVTDDVESEGIRPILVSESASSIAPVDLNLTRKPEQKSDKFGRRFFTSDDVGAYEGLEESGTLPGALDTCNNDISHISPYHMPSFNFAAYANDSPLIQELAKLGVELYKVEGKKDAMATLLKYNFDDLKPYIQFLHDSGVPADGIGAFITKNPYIFNNEIDDLHTRIRYLRAHKFDTEMVARVVTQNPYWLMFSTKRIDGRLGYFQREFSLTGKEIRNLATKQSRLITVKMARLKENTFSIREEMGFNKVEVKTILLSQPRIFMKTRAKMVEVFDFLHNTMKLSHNVLALQPGVLTCRLERLQQRHKFLEKLGRAQYDPKEPLYVSPIALVTGSDVEFCRNVARTAVETYNLFLKTL